MSIVYIITLKLEGKNFDTQMILSYSNKITFDISILVVKEKGEKKRDLRPHKIKESHVSGVCCPN